MTVKKNPQKEALAGLRILMIEDSDTDAYLVERSVHQHLQGARFARVPTMKEGEALLEAGTTDVVLLDLGLPDTADPADTYARIKKWTDKIPVIIMTNLKDHDFAKVMVHEGAADFLNKEVIAADPRTLRNTIDFSLERHAAAARLMAEKERAVKESKEKDAILSCFMGGYSVHNDGKGDS